jgi:AcrR family transcriptional regulator
MVTNNEKPTRGRPRTMNEEAVLDVAVSAYQKTDPADVSVNAICQMAGISKPSLYRAFGNARTKETLRRRTFVERRLSRAAAAGFGDWQRQGRGPNRRSGLILINDLELLDWGKEG